jgi:hypothetical protein
MTPKKKAWARLVAVLERVVLRLTFWLFSKYVRYTI